MGGGGSQEAKSENAIFHTERRPSAWKLTAECAHKDTASILALSESITVSARQSAVFFVVDCVPRHVVTEKNGTCLIAYLIAVAI